MAFVLSYGVQPPLRLGHPPGVEAGAEHGASSARHPGPPPVMQPRPSATSPAAKRTGCCPVRSSTRHSMSATDPANVLRRWGKELDSDQIRPASAEKPSREAMGPGSRRSPARTDRLTVIDSDSTASTEGRPSQPDRRGASSGKTNLERSTNSPSAAGSPQQCHHRSLPRRKDVGSSVA